MNNLLNIISVIKEISGRVFQLTFLLSHIAGKVFITILFLSASAILAHVISKELGYPLIFSDFYLSAKTIYLEPIAWAATSVIIATTVAIGHMKNLEFNRIKITIDQEEQWVKKEKRRDERRNKLDKFANK